MTKISNNIERDIELIKYMMKNENLSKGTMEFLINYLIEQIEKNKTNDDKQTN